MSTLADLSTQLSTSSGVSLHSHVELLEKLASCLPIKDLQVAFPALLADIFGADGRRSWGLRSVSRTRDPRDVKAVCDFLSPTGTIFKICYKLISDPLLKYAFPVRLLPVDLIQILENGKIPQFYLDLIALDPHSRQIVSLNLNPFDYYIFHFAVHLYYTSYSRDAGDSWNTLYFDLACDYLFHFLPSDLNSPVLPHIPYFTGKTPAVSPMQVANRHSQFPSLLMFQDAPVSSSGSTQFHPRGEIWRSETVLQIFVDVWLSTASLNEFQQFSSTACSTRSSYPASEHVRLARALIKQCHGFSLGGSGDPTSLGELRRMASALLAPRAHSHIRHLMHTWPLDTSFRLVLELWFSFIQPWRYSNPNNKKYGSQMEYNRLHYNTGTITDNSPEETTKSAEISASYIPFITDNLLAYTEIFQLVVPRFLRLNLTVPKNATMLYRLTKVFSQSNLIKILSDIENSVANDLEPIVLANSSFSNQALASNMPHSFHNVSSSIIPNGSGSSMDSGHQIFLQANSMFTTCAWESIDGNDTITSNQYCPLLLGKGRNMAKDLLLYAIQAHLESREILHLKEEQIKLQKKGFFSSLYFWLMADNTDEISLEEIKKVPLYLSIAISQLGKIFALEDEIKHNEDINRNSNVYQNDSFLSQQRTSGNKKFKISLLPRQAKEKASHIKYMGDPDKQPIKSYENGFLIRILYHLSSKINEMYYQEITDFWEKDGLVGAIAKEIIMPPCTIHTFSKGSSHETQLISQSLPPRISFRSCASHTNIFWFTVCIFMSYLFGYEIFTFFLSFISLFIMYIVLKGLFKWIFKISERNDENVYNNFIDSNRNISTSQL